MSPRGRRIFLGLAALVLFAFARTTNDGKSPVPDARRVGWVEIRHREATPKLRTLAAPAVPSYFDAMSRVEPDRRALYAVAEVRRLLRGGTSERAVLVRFDGGQWIVRLGEEDVGRLPEIPSFADLLRLVRSSAGRESKTAHGAEEAPRASAREALAKTLDSGSVPDVLEALRSLEDDGRARRGTQPSRGSRAAA